MRDNTLNANGIEVYQNEIYYYADQYIKNELEIDKVTEDNRSIITNSFVDMILYIAENIEKPSNDNIKLLDDIFNIYKRLCSKYGVLPTLECFSFLVSINRTTFTDWMNGEYRTTTAHGNTAKKWFDICKSFLVNNLQNSKGTDANKIFVAKAAYGMAEAAPVQMAQPQGIPHQSREEIAARHAGYIGAKDPERPEI